MTATAEIAPGVSVHFIGGHTMGLQSVRVMTRRGWVVLASDAAHLYAHLAERRAFPTVYNVADMLDGHDVLRRLASSERHIVPGHDPLVMRRYPAAAAGPRRHRRAARRRAAARGGADGTLLMFAPLPETMRRSSAGRRG